MLIQSSHLTESRPIQEGQRQANLIIHLMLQVAFARAHLCSFFGIQQHFCYQQQSQYVFDYYFKGWISKATTIATKTDVSS